MASNAEIKRFVKDHYGFVPDNCWIAHARLARREAHICLEKVDIGTSKRRCSDSRRDALFAALELLGD